MSSYGTFLKSHCRFTKAHSGNEQGIARKPLFFISHHSHLFFLPRRLGSKASAASDVEFVIWDPPVEIDSAADVADETRREESEQQQQQEEEEAEEGPAFEPRLKLPAHLKDLKVQVSHVKSPSSFYVQFTENSRQLKRLVIGPNLLLFLLAPVGLVRKLH